MEGSKLQIFLLAIGSPVLLVLTHIALVRAVKALGKKVNQQAFLFLIIIGLNPLIAASGYGITQGLSFEDVISTIFYLLLVYNSLGYVYFHLFNMSDTARRIKLLILIAQGKLQNIEEIEADYSPRAMLKTRIERLLGMKQIEAVEDGRLVIKGSLLLNASQIINFWKALLGITKE